MPSNWLRAVSCRPLAPLCTRRSLHVRARLFGFARKFISDVCTAGLPLPTSRADLETPNGLGTANAVSCGPAHKEPPYIKSLMNIRANPNSLARTCNFAGAGPSAILAQLCTRSYYTMIDAREKMVCTPFFSSLLLTIVSYVRP